MKTLQYLWFRREQPRIFSARWCKVWAKRVWNAPALVSLLLRASLCSIRGVRLGPLVVLSEIEVAGRGKNLMIGERTFIGKNVHLALHAPISIGRRVVINNGARLLTGSHDVNDSVWSLTSAPIVINDYAWIAVDAIVLPGVTIGEGAVVGAGAVVTRDVARRAVVVGNPARQIGRRPDELDYSPVDLSAAFEAWLGRPDLTKRRIIPGWHEDPSDDQC